MQTSSQNTTIDLHEDDAVISSDRVDGTSVYNLAGDKLGSIKELMIGKKDGQVRFAVLTFGGFLGIGENYYPLPWNALTYQPDQGGYVVDLSRQQLDDAPSYTLGREPVFNQAYGRHVYGYYGFPW